MRLLEGVKVVEFASHVVVPAATRVMAEWGAEVIKIERPEGDRWRNYSYGCPGEFTYTVLSSGKRMTSLNMKAPEGREALYRMLKDADVFCTNVRPAAVKRLGLDYDTIHARRQKHPFLRWTTLQELWLLFRELHLRHLRG